MDNPPPQAPPESRSTAWFDRAGQSGDERRKSLVSYCVAAVGAYFVRLTGTDLKELSLAERHVVLFALMAFGIGVMSGVLAWHFAGRYFHAKGTAKEDEALAAHQKKRNADGTLAWSFGVGVILTLALLVLRMLSA